MNNDKYYELLMKLHKEAKAEEDYLLRRLILLIAEKALDDSIYEGSLDA